MGDGGVLVSNDEEAPEIHDDGFEAEEVREEESENDVRRERCYPVACINGTLLGFCLYPINPGRFSNQYRTGADRCTPKLPR